MLGLLQLHPGSVALASRLIGPGQVERVGRVPGVAGPGAAELDEGSIGLAGLDQDHGAGIHQKRVGSHHVDGVVDQCQSLLSLVRVPQCQQPGQVVQRVDAVGLDRQEPAEQALRLVEAALAHPDQAELGRKEGRPGLLPGGLGHPGFHLAFLGVIHRRGLEDLQRDDGDLRGTADRPGFLEDLHRLGNPVLDGQELGQGEGSLGLTGVAGREGPVGRLGLLGESVATQEVGDGADLVGDVAFAGLQ